MKKLLKIVWVLFALVLAILVFFSITDTGKSWLDILWQEALKLDIEIKIEQDKKAVLLRQVELQNKIIIEKRRVKDNIWNQYNKLRNNWLEYKQAWYVQKVYAGVDTQEWIKEEIKKNSENWDKLEVKRVRIVQIQTGLNEVNNNLRDRVETNWVNMYALALAVSKHETASCTKGYGKSNFNCQGIKNWRNCPCTVSKYNNFCQFESQEESHQHFICVWTKWYWWKLPNLYMAKRYSWDDRALIWRNNVLQFYKEFNQWQY